MECIHELNVEIVEKASLTNSTEINERLFSNNMDLFLDELT
jgi:hypothetical protein